jgi:hypothetical protein
MRAFYGLQNRISSLNAVTAEIESDTSHFSFSDAIEMFRAFECELSTFPSIKIREIRYVPVNASSGLTEA